MSAIDRHKAASREVWSLVSLYLGLGIDDTPVPSLRRGAAFMAVQSAVVTALGAIGALLKPLVFGAGVGAVWPLTLLVLMLPLAAGVARQPPRLVAGLAGAVPAGLLAGVITWVVLRGSLSGFWLWFAVLAVGCALAGPVFGALAPDDPAGQRTGSLGEPAGQQTASAGG